jgi:Na+/H+ antiporter NhaA
LAALAVVILASALLRSRLSVIAWSVLAMAAWALCARAGIDPPLSAVAVGVLVPSHTREYAESVWKWLTASVNLVVLPLFALVAVGVNWSLVISTPHGWSFALVLAGARVAGKVLGITVGARVGARIAGVAPLGGQTLVATGLICAVGITVPLIFARQAFGTSGLYGLTTATLISVSVMGGVGGIGLLRRARRSRGWVLD